MHLNYPHTIIKAKHQPTKGAIVYIHGGGLMFGKANDLSPQYIDILTEHYDLIPTKLSFITRSKP